MLNINILLASAFLWPISYGDSCKLDKTGIYRFGTNCGFMCHCKIMEQCDSISGECESGCAKMLYGPGCQYRDIAEGQFSRHLDNMYPAKYSQLANDGVTGTCSYTAEANSSLKKTNPFWRVWLPTKEIIRELLIFTHVEALKHFKSFSVYVENVRKNQMSNNSFIPPDRKECFKHDDVVPKNETMTVLCKTPVAGNQVRIELAALHTQLVLCDVRINGDCTSGTYGENCSGYCSDHCYGGNNVCSPVDGRCLSGCKAGWSGEKCDTACQEGRYGPECKNSCPLDCLNDNRCNKENGNCESGCKPGYQGQKCDQECQYGKYGTKCRQNCTSNCSGGYRKCSHVNGTCTSGCNPGWTGARCDEVCFSGYYGNACKHNCSANCLGGYSNCDNVYGSCISGCLPGWTGRQCEKTCPSGSWGLTCVNICGHCHFNTCRATDGVCESKCAEGYKQTPHCDRECENGTYGISCLKSCSKNCKDVCNKRTGVCSQCTSGWHGDTCTFPCAQGRWGEHCIRRCHTCLSDACDRVTGACLGLCKPGFKQTQFCDQVVDQTETSSMLQISVGDLAGTCVAAFVLISASIFITACICRRKYLSAFTNGGIISVAETTVSFSNVQQPAAEEISVGMMESIYESIRESSEDEHDYVISQNQSR